MPFRPELNYFFLYLKRYLEEKYKIRVERGDSSVLTKELMNKISGQISAASFLIADITGSNANVFFELGIAIATDKPIIFLTQDAPKDAPVDIRQFEFIHYELASHRDFLAKLDNAVRNVLVPDLEISRMYEIARGLLKQFGAETGLSPHQASREDFHERVVLAAEEPGIPPPGDTPGLAGFLLLRILQDLTDLHVAQRMAVWLDQRYPPAT
jgi:hypothetical protein